MALQDRINKRETKVTLRVVPEPRRLPEWLRRRNENALPVKDMTGEVKVA